MTFCTLLFGSEWRWHGVTLLLCPFWRVNLLHLLVFLIVCRTLKCLEATEVVVTINKVLRKIECGHICLGISRNCSLSSVSSNRIPKPCKYFASLHAQTNRSFHLTDSRKVSLFKFLWWVKGTLPNFCTCVFFQRSWCGICNIRGYRPGQLIMDDYEWTALRTFH